jgi:murein DD-endopeptidase MepM/ murein hydrolase activator NlpD
VAVPPVPEPGSSAGSYCWPVKPFGRQHPVRGSFGDPRTVFKVPPTQRGLITGDGSFSFHFGVDISAPDGTSVYPVASGIVSKVTAQWVGVDTGNGRFFQYWHVKAAVGAGDHVQARKTVLGTILPSCGHVHLSELQQGRPVNPLVKGHLTPYTDRTKPQVESISFRAAAGVGDMLPNFLRGAVEIVAEAYDTPSMAVSGDWEGMPVAPALLTWRIQKPSGKVVVEEQVGVDFRATIPANKLFWSYYARGTYQNCCVFGPHYSFRQPGRFLFKLTRKPFDTKAVPDGVYDLVVTATDIRGNRGSRSRRFTVHNRPGWVGS